MPSNAVQQISLNASYVKDPGIQSQVCEINDHKNTNLKIHDPEVLS